MLKKAQNVYMPIERFQAKVFKHADMAKRGEWATKFALALGEEEKEPFAEELLKKGQIDFYENAFRTWKYNAKKALSEKGISNPTKKQIYDWCLEEYGEEFSEAYNLLIQSSRRLKKNLELDPAPQESAGENDHQSADKPLREFAAPAAKTQQSFPRQSQALVNHAAPDGVLNIGQTFMQDDPIRKDGLNLPNPQGAKVKSGTSCEPLSRQVVDRKTCRPVELDGTADTDTREGLDDSKVPLSAKPIEPKDAYGDNKTVLLTMEEGAKLREVYGDDLEMAIDILDAYLVNGGTKGKKYKSHFAVMKKGSWVWNRVQESKAAEKRLEKAEATVDRRTPYQKNQDDLLQLVKMTERSLTAI